MPAPPSNNDVDRKVVLRGLVRAESMVQIALAIPLSTVIGWGLGDWLDHKFHQSWIAMLGLGLGAIAGFVQIVRLANRINSKEENGPQAK